MSTETADPRFADIDIWPTRVAVEAMLQGQRDAIAALDGQVHAIATAAEAAAARLKQGGRLIYAGAGTSGRIAIQDGVELTPTYDWPVERLVYLMAGGMNALIRGVEGAEDDAAAARAEIADAGVGALDVAIGVAASGRTPYTLAAIVAARAAGALTIGIANNPDTPLLAAADHPLLADTGSEPVAGSTRMKAGTAQKAALNLLSTAIMIRCGRVHRGLMVGMRVSNAKLRTRAVAIVCDLAQVDESIARDALDRAALDIRRAVLIARGADAQQAADLLRASDGDLRSAIALRSGERRG